MRQVVQHVLTPVICLTFVAGCIVGCASFGATAREPPRAATDTAVGADGGNPASGLLSQDATGAAVGSPGGGLVGGVVGKAMDMQREDLAYTASLYKYDPTQGTVVHIQDAAVEPPIVGQGGQVNLVTHYALLTPTPDAEVTVVERWHITRDGAVLGSPVRTVQRQGGAWVSTLPVLLPTTVASGDYRVTLTVEAVEQQDSESTNFTVR